MSHENLFEEFGVRYTRDRKLARELNFLLFKYKSSYKGNVFPREVYCENKRNFDQLMKGWNLVDPDNWKHE